MSRMACQRTREILLKIIIWNFCTVCVAGQCPTGFTGSNCTKKNIAYNKSTSQSDRYGHHYSKLAVDGNTGPAVWTCSHTDITSPSFWKVTLDPVTEYNITNITLFLRNKHASRYKNMTIEVDGSLCKRIDITNTDSEDPPFPNVVYVAGCDQHLMGKEVTVRAQSSYLTLCEVQIWVCVDTWFGFDCDKRCRCLNSSEICNKETGYCASGCDRGRQGEGCQTACKNGTFGTCLQNCNWDNSTEICNMTTGICHCSRCKHGAYKPDCQTACRNKTYGPNCIHPCGQCKNSSECNPETGACSNGCEAGLKPDKCDEVCDEGTYGDCSLLCGHCHHNETCNRVNGTCPNGCQDGYVPPLCKVCGDTWFGFDCDKRCRCLNSNDICNKETGYCASGCDRGWQGEGCQTACKNGTFGTCLQNCNWDNSTEICNKTTAVCPYSGCKHGAYEPDCQTACRNKTYGPNCIHPCGQCKNSSVCNPETGACSNGCEAGLKPDKCDEVCDEGSYGDCSLLCGHCHHNETCNRVNGTCPNGCQDRYVPPLCKVYVDTWFGFDCDKRCRCLNSSEICDKKTGLCKSGCDRGWQGEGCQRVCDEGTHGDCSSLCGHCHHNESCIKVNGTCPNGCQDEYLPPLCKEVTAPLPEPESSSSLGSIVAGAVVAILVLVAVGVGMIIYFRRRQVNNKSQGNEDQVEVRKEVEMNNLDEENDGGQPPATQCRDSSYEATDPYYKNIPANIPLENLNQQIRDKISQGGFEEEFKMLPYGIHAGHDEGKKPENKKRNRFLNLFPYDHSRVKLIPEGDSTWDYINASFVSGYSDKTTFIAAQGPNPLTVNDFWRMVWQQNVRKIVMLTRLVEMDKKKCHKYWPEINEKIQCGAVSVETTCVTVRADFTIRKFRIQHTSSPTRTVTQFHFTTWPDHDVPAAPALVGFWKQVKNADTQTKEETGPPVIHCSAGVGRTGTFIALDSLVTQAETEGKVNIFMCVGEMRRERMNMVQTVFQYQFVYEVLQEALESRGTFYTMSQFDQKYGLNFTYAAQQEEELKTQFESLQSLKISLTNNLVGDALSPENINKNRSKAIVPAKRNRPHLSTPVSGRNDYINAVMLPSPDRSGFFIVTQTPLPETVVDFWRLVYDRDCSTIVCLDESEDARSLYDGGKNVGPFHVERVSEDKSRDNYTFSKMKISRKKESKRDLEVYQLVPIDTTSGQQNTAAILEFINVLNICSIGEDEKMLVHCFDGSRLSGVFCTMMNIVSSLRLDKEVDIFLIIRELQEIRPQFIPTYNQYKLCHDMVKEYIRSANVYANM